MGVEFGSLKLLERHKMLVWRTTTGCMPAKDNLNRFFEVADFSGASVASTQVWFPPIRSYVKINNLCSNWPEVLSHTYVG